MPAVGVVRPIRFEHSGFRSGHRRRACRAGAVSARRFSVLHLVDGVVVCITAVNSPRDLRLGRKLVRAASSLKPPIASTVRA
ncbi:oxidoreductase C-terminal domain-containing protein [Variovorax sp. E3]|uniref:oxidoreductase C-terminal domain-containing protein n=1 Tax=Variovorax sp. E3 TaxID=1914993 RepID=UPI0018DE0931